MRKQDLLVIDAHATPGGRKTSAARIARKSAAHAKPWRKLVKQLRDDRISIVRDADLEATSAVLRQAKLWIVAPFASLSQLAGLKLAADLLFPQSVAQPRFSFLESIFRKVVAAEVLLGADELSEALVAPNREDLFVGGTVDWDDEVLLLFRGNLEQVSVPFAWFSRLPARRPDFERFALIDYGNTVKLGDYEAATDAILYDFDARFRSRLRALRRKQDNSLGGSIRRLRNQRGLRQSDFAPISEKQIRRIEAGEIARPRPATLERIARRLGVAASELRSY